MGIAEIFGAVSGLLYVLLEIRQNKFMWIVGGISALVYLVVFFDSALYASFGLQLYYVWASVYGWVKWNRLSTNATAEDPAVYPLAGYKAFLSGIVATAGFAVLWYILANFTEDPMPVLDAMIASLSMLATYWVANKYIQHWMLWIVADVMAVYMYLSQGLYATVVLYFIYIIAAIAGFWHWRKFTKVLD
ncbi:MAG: nicotinamide riboside transporter PnuC [Bacteroidia bacterium]|jgi:nicotinamide mononucleotide transporter|nr:nicotinamide riboside transporter PnuC [Bacteroidales bacterium]MDD3843966.1 nicotinamide riboside transporter PnuC [Bacteroidales bacterium]MDD4618626.1 nicotinamide riboside transporter PnuC [Bacteroidales bacterium]NCC46574.1 nicotinamide riboside transporter PnuC [Bacteroidia bacterium]